MNKILIILSTFIFLTSSCGFIVKRIYKIKRPKDENLNMQIKYLDHNNLNTSDLYRFKAEFKSRLIAGEYPLYDSDTNSFKPIQTRVFDLEGKPLSNWASCYGKVSNMINEDVVVPILPNINQELTLDSFIKNILPYDSNISNMDTPKMTFISIWAIYLGTPSRNRLAIIDSFCTNNSDKYRHIKVNLGNL